MLEAEGEDEGGFAYASMTSPVGMTHGHGHGSGLLIQEHGKLLDAPERRSGTMHGTMACGTTAWRYAQHTNKPKACVSICTASDASIGYPNIDPYHH